MVSLSKNYRIWDAQPSCVFMEVIYRLDFNVNLPAPGSEDNVWHTELESELPWRNVCSDSGITFYSIRKSILGLMHQ